MLSASPASALQQIYIEFKTFFNAVLFSAGLDNSEHS